MILFTALKNPQWMVSAKNTTYSPMLLSDTYVSLSQHGLSGVDKGQRHCTPHCLRKDTPVLLGGCPVALPVGTSVTTALLGFTLHQRVVTFPFCCSNATNCSSGCFLPPDSGLGGSSDVEVAALEVIFFDPSTLDFVLAVVGLFLCMLRLVLSPTLTDKMVSKPSPSPLASFSEGFF
jgi:hypothetical protein